MAATTIRATEPLVIGGERSQSQGPSMEVRDPANGELLALVAEAGPEGVAAAVGAARAAVGSAAWGGIAPSQRGRLMYRIARRIEERTEELAILESRDTGKPLRQARSDVRGAARYFEFFAGIADKIMGETIPLGPGFVDYTVREPIGVSAQIVPWNYPIQIAARGLAPALAAGCAVVLKASVEAPLTSLKLAEIALECDLPPGALNVITGTGTGTGTPLVRHPDVDQITFTGSVEVGIEVAKMAAENVRPVVMELGGKSPNIVFADSDLDDVVPGVARAIFQNAGQTCSAGSRLLVERRIHDEIVARLVESARKMRLGPGLTDPDMGPLISARQLSRVEGYIAAGRSDGARIATGGKRPTDPALERGHFIEPTVLDRVLPAMSVAQDEIFGPVLSVIAFDSLEEAAAIAEGTRYGLVAAIWTRDIDKAMALASRVRAGQVYVNGYRSGAGVEMPFGGYKMSGYGREKGLESLRSYTQVKNVCIKFH